MKVFGKAGNVYYNFSRGIDDRPVVVHSERKSVGCEHTFEQDISQPTIMIIELYHVVLELVERIRKSGFSGRTLTLKVKFQDFTQITRSQTLEKQLCTKSDILPVAKLLQREIDCTKMPIRLLGLSVSNPPSEEGLSDKYPRWVEGELYFQE